jgi:hypothetical protein
MVGAGGTLRSVNGVKCPWQSAKALPLQLHKGSYVLEGTDRFWRSALAELSWQTPIATIISLTITFFFCFAIAVLPNVCHCGHLPDKARSPTSLGHQRHLPPNSNTLSLNVVKRRFKRS